MALKGIYFKMPEQEYQELKDLVSEKSVDIPGLTISTLIREGIRNEVLRVRSGNDEITAKEIKSSKFFEMVSEFFRDDLGWRRQD